MKNFKTICKTSIFILSSIISIFLIIEGSLLFQLDKFSNTDKINKYDYMLILGSGLQNNQMTEILKSRLDKALEYINKYPNLKIIVSGGITGSNTITEAELMSRYLQQNNVSKDKILLENKSTSTFENIKFTSQILKLDSNFKKHILVVTSDFHLPRALHISRNFGLEPDGLSSKTESDSLYRYLLREFPRVIGDSIRSNIYKIQNIFKQ